MQSSSRIYPNARVSYWLPVLTPEISPINLHEPCSEKSLQDLRNFNTPTQFHSPSWDLPPLDLDCSTQFWTPNGGPEAGDFLSKRMQFISSVL
jgi:hypothetical protein